MQHTGKPARNSRPDRDALFARPRPTNADEPHEDDGADERAPLRSRPLSSTAADGRSAVGGAAARPFGNVSQLAMRQELDEQDAVLDALHSSVTRLGSISEKIHEEIVVQDRMLDDLDESVLRADAAVNSATRRTRELIRRGGGGRWCCVLTVLGVVLGLLLIYILVS
jgi:hypothetical protein